MNILLNSELMCLLAIIFVVLAIPLTGFIAMLYGGVSILCITIVLINHINDDIGDDDF